MVCFRGFSYVFFYILFVANILVRVAKQFLRQVAFIAEAHRFHAAVFADIKFRNRGVAADTNITQTFNIVLQISHAMQRNKKPCDVMTAVLPMQSAFTRASAFFARS